MLQAVANSPRNQSAQKPISMAPVDGLGDDALFSSVGSYSKLIVKKGDAVFQLVVYSDVTVEKKRDMEKTLAAKVLSGLSSLRAMRAIEQAKGRVRTQTTFGF